MKIKKRQKVKKPQKIYRAQHFFVDIALDSNIISWNQIFRFVTFEIFYFKQSFFMFFFKIS